MSLTADVLALENRAIGRGGEQTLPLAYERLLEQWRGGARGREVALHLAFLAWYMLAEPPFLTRASEAVVPSLPAVFSEVHDYLLPRADDDAEVLYVFGLMADLFPWVLGGEHTWEARAQTYLRKYRTIEPAGLRPEVFAGRGFYGDYFAGHASRQKRT